MPGVSAATRSPRSWTPRHGEPLPLKIARSVASAAPMIGRSPEGWMTFSGDEATEVQIESVRGTGSASAQVLAAKKEARHEPRGTPKTEAAGAGAPAA